MTAAEAQEEARKKMTEAAEAAVPKSNADLFASPEDARLIAEAKAANKDSMPKKVARDFIGQFGANPKGLRETMETPEFQQYADRLAPKPEAPGVLREDDKAKIAAARANMTPEQQARLDAMSADVSGMKTGREAFAPKEEIKPTEGPMFKALPAKVTPEQAAAMVPESVDRYQEQIEKPRIRTETGAGGGKVPAWIPEAKADTSGAVATVEEKPVEAPIEAEPTTVADKIKKGGLNFADVIEALAKGYTHDTTKTNLQERREQEYKEKENEFFRKLSGEKETAAEQRAAREAAENERIYRERMALANFYETQQARERFKNELALQGGGGAAGAPVSVWDRYGGE